jgi:adenylate cyclase
MPDMKCEGCGFDAPADFSFCPKCGRKFADQGSIAPRPPLAQPAAPTSEADRRPATILFADLTGFTALSERLDPEDVRALQTDLFDEMRVVLQREDAFVEKFVGDAVMAVFGAPTAHEDDPQRALRAALHMHERVAALTECWKHRLQQPLLLHIGINTGRVVAGHIGSSASAAYAVTGDTVNVASRLQSAAAPGTTLVSRDTHALTRDEFEFEPGGTVQLKGKSQPLAVFRLVRLASSSQGTDRDRVRASGLASRMVGRAQELAQLHEALQRMLGAGAQVVSVAGDAGIGKSRLVDEFLGQVRASSSGAGLTIRRTSCQAHQMQPYGVIARFFRDGFGLAPADSLQAVQAKVEAGLSAAGAQADDIALVVPMAGYLLGLNALQDLRDVEPERLNRQISMALRIVLDYRLRQAPLMLVIEDLQWADAASLEALSAMADWLHQQPLLMVLTFRPSFDAASFAIGRASHTALQLGPLDGAQIEEVLACCFGSGGLGWMPSVLLGRLVERAGGNPFFLEEMVRSLMAAKVLVAQEQGWFCDERETAAEVPATLEGLLLSRIDRLAPAQRHCLQEAAVLGATFDAALLRGVAGEGFEEALLDELCSAGYLASVTSGGTGSDAATSRGYRFCHLIARDVVYQNLLLRRRTELHGRIGRLLEARRSGSGDRFVDLESLGHHFSLSDEPARGARYLVAAGDWARGIYANDDAVRLYQRAQAALSSCPDCDPDEVLDISERLGDMFGPTGRREQAFAHYGRVLHGARQAADRRREARIQRKVAGLHWDAGAREQSLTCLNAGLQLLEGAEADIETAHLLQEMGRFAFRTGDNEAAVKWAERALADAQRAADLAAKDSAAHRDASTAAAQAMNTLGAALARLDRPEEAVSHIERSITIAEAEGLLHAACRGYANLGVLYATFNPGRAIETCKTGLDTAKRIGDLGFQSRLYANLAVAYCALTNQCDIEGLRAAQAAIDLDRQLGQIDHLAVPLIVLAQIHQCHGDPEAALRYYEEARLLAEGIGEPQLLFPVYDGLGTLYLDLGDPVKAEAYLVKANEVCESAGLDRDTLVVLPFLC